MSRIENVVQASSHDHRISHRLQCIPCGRCYAVIEYDRGTEWSVVSELVNEHWKACPGKPHARPAHMARTPPSPPDIAIALSPPLAPKQRSSSYPVAEPVGFPNNTWISSGCERKRRTLEQRKLELEQDEYAQNITTKSVVCGGCHKEISLDKRSKYYPGLWLKHRGKCPCIEKLERAKSNLKVPQLNDTRQVPCDAVVPMLDGNGCGGEIGPAERHESYSATAVHRLVRQYDSEDPSSEDEDEDGDSWFQEPFPTLNSDFYWSQRYYNRSDEWTYRYATKDEITTNLFRGQDEPCAGLGSRPFTHLIPQIGGHCGTSRCVIKNRVEQAFSHPDSFMSTKELSEPVAPHTLLSTLIHLSTEGHTLGVGKTAEETNMA